MFKNLRLNYKIQWRYKSHRPLKLSTVKCKFQNAGRWNPWLLTPSVPVTLSHKVVYLSTATCICTATQFSLWFIEVEYINHLDFENVILVITRSLIPLENAVLRVSYYTMNMTKGMSVFIGHMFSDQPLPISIWRKFKS